MLRDEGVEYTVIPGATAFVSALILSGLDASRFTFIGFLPEKAKDRESLLKQYKNNSESYACPFLINDECSVYEYRGIVCRTFGLAQLGPNSELKVPFCAYDGLNYSNVIDLETGKVSAEKFKRLNTDLEPLAFNIAYLNLVDEDIAKAFGFEFGEIKSLAEWLI